MGVISIRIDDKRRKALKIIAALEGKSMNQIITELIDDYIRKNRKKIIDIIEDEDLFELMKLSETSFKEWDNEEDAIYDDL